MPISSKTSPDGKKLTIAVSDRFDYALHQGFRDAYRASNQPGTEFVLDLSQAQYMDSSALGMILLLKEHAEKLGGRIVIFRPNEAVKKILDIAKFDRFMKIES